MGTLFAMFFIGIPVLIALAAFVALFLWVGSSVAGIEGRTYGKSFMSIGAYFFASWMMNFILGLVGINAGVIPFVLGIVLAVFIIQKVFATTWLKAFIAWLIHFVALIVVVGIPLMLLFGAAALAMITGHNHQ